MSDQVDKTTFEQQITSRGGRVVKVTVRHRQTGDPQFGSWRGQIFDFPDFNSFEVLGRSGVYRRTFLLKFDRPHGLVGERWTINREVSGLIPSPKSAG
jgi:hypothetical protein